MRLPPHFPPKDSILAKRQHVLGGRGATVMWAALEAIAARSGTRGEVVLPDIVCPCVLEVVVAAGFTPRFAAVDSDKFCVTPQIIKPLLSERTSAVIAVHLFGYVAPIDELALLLKETGVYLIEDAVQAIGGILPSGKPVGSSGDFSFVSFDPSKMIRGRGGMLFYDDDIWTPLLLNTLARAQRTGESPSERLCNISLRDLYHGLGQALRLGIMTPRDAASAFRSALPQYRHLLFSAFDEQQSNLDTISHQWSSLSERVSSRNDKARALQEALSGYPVRCPSIQSGDAVWRYTVEFSDRAVADHFVLAMRERGGLVSHLYYPLHQLFAPEQSVATAELASRLVNLWVDETINDDYVRLVREAAKSVF